MKQTNRGLGVGALLSAVFAAIFSILFLVTGARLLTVLAILAAVLGVVFALLILSKPKSAGGKGSASSVLAEGNIPAAIEQLEQMAEGNFTDGSASDGSDPLLSAVERVRHAVGGMMGAITGDVTAISESGTHLSDASASLSQVFFRQDEMLRGIYSPVMTVSGAAAKNAETAREANRYASAAAADVQNGANRMQELLHAMDEINRSTDEIAKFIKTIEDIAFQTNILALNSSVEAAHAGEAGKGFAVVATEVKTLANRSQEAAKSTSRLIQSCVENVRIGMEKTGAAVKALADASEETRSVTGLIDVISRECDAQSESIGKINQDFVHIEGIMKQANEAATECAEGIQILSGHSDRLRDDLKDFKGAVASGGRSSEARPIPAMKPMAETKPAPTTSTTKPAAAAKPATTTSTAKPTIATKPAPAASTAKPATTTTKLAPTTSTAKPATAAKPAPAASAMKPMTAAKPAPMTSATKPATAAKPAPATSATKPATAAKPAPTTSATKPTTTAAKPAPAASTAKPATTATKPASAASTAKPATATKPAPAASAAKPATAAKPAPAAPAAKPATAAKPAPAASTAKPTTAAKPAPAASAAKPATAAAKPAPSAPVTRQKSEPMPTSLPEKFEGAQFVDIPDSKY